MQKIFIGWVYGSGKSSIINQIIKTNSKTYAFGIGPYMKKIALEEWIIQSEKNIKNISENERSYLYDRAQQEMHNIIISQIYDTFILDAHYSIYKWDQIQKSIDDSIVNEYDRFILIEADPQDIVQRITNDAKERIFESFTIVDIQKHMQIEKQIAKEVSDFAQKPLVIIKNDILGKAIQEVMGIM